MGHHDGCADERARRSQGHGETEFILQKSAVLVDPGEMVVVLEGGEAAAAHGVLKEGGRVEAGDEGLMHLREAELPASPEEVIVGGDHASELRFGGIGHGAHGQGESDYLDAGGEREASVYGSVDGDAVAEGEELAQVMPFKNLQE